MSFPERLRIFFRLAFMQSLWGRARMQNLGLLFAITPALRRIYGTEEGRREAFLRHTEFFNTNPFMSGFAAGFVSRLEEDAVRRGGQPQEYERLRALKRVLGSSLAAVGDTLIWGALLPACAAAAVFAACLCWLYDLPFAALSCALFYLFLFNAPALFLKWRGIQVGGERGEALAVELESWNLKKKARWVARAGFFFAVAAPALLLLREATFSGPVVLFSAAAIVGFVFLRRVGAPSALLYALCGIAALGWRGVWTLL